PRFEREDGAREGAASRLAIDVALERPDAFVKKSAGERLASHRRREHLGEFGLLEVDLVVLVLRLDAGCELLREIFGDTLEDEVRAARRGLGSEPLRERVQDFMK